jgi:hypothetical protein
MGIIGLHVSVKRTEPPPDERRRSVRINIRRGDDDLEEAGTRWVVAHHVLRSAEHDLSLPFLGERGHEALIQLHQILRGAVEYVDVR